MTAEWMELRSLNRFKACMEYRGETVRSLAGKSLVQDEATQRWKALHPSLIGHLRSGHRRTCSPTTAHAIEKALGAKPGELFAARAIERRAAA